VPMEDKTPKLPCFPAAGDGTEFEGGRTRKEKKGGESGLLGKFKRGIYSDQGTGRLIKVSGGSAELKGNLWGCRS